MSSKREWAGSSICGYLDRIIFVPYCINSTQPLWLVCNKTPIIEGVVVVVELVFNMRRLVFPL